jgi:hypothetical protein
VATGRQTVSAVPGVRLLYGAAFAVKVQRPNIDEQLRSVTRILECGSAVLERRVVWAADADLTGLVRERDDPDARARLARSRRATARLLQGVLAPVRRRASAQAV